ncbi:glutamate-5-semialdehyde dehydrogenase [Providencia rettgeri]|uniref:glutamate-5-semialdehyde dehydrogenase n=1 Tax=Providencia rettgeri TaxID=587 RepID=UPI0032DB8DC1
MNKQGIETIMQAIGKDARNAASHLINITAEQRKKALILMAKYINESVDAIIEANSQDLFRAKKIYMNDALIDRLLMDKTRIYNIGTSLHQIAELDDPVGQIISEWSRPNGINIRKIRTPIGIIGMIYESRPNVTVEASALCIKSGNVAILRGGRDALNTSKALFSCIQKGIIEAGLPEKTIQLITITDHCVVSNMLSGLDGNLDILIPRGGRKLMQRVREEAKIPILSHQEGICHLYVDKSANLTMAKNLIINSKLRRTSICGATETLLIDNQLRLNDIIDIITSLNNQGCEVRICKSLMESITENHKFLAATSSDWGVEFMDSIISVKLVNGIDGAISHIHRYSSGHTDGIIASDTNAVTKFFAEVNSALVMHNISTQFADGGEFGFGGEIGISTGKLHARGPIGAEQLTSFKYHLSGNGQIRY